ncbi:MAG: MipA/OmpV family protein [Marinagarivorans sp.]|nr:MipA/OmpV family protein [Marinagarivorans sp.]
MKQPLFLFIASLWLLASTYASAEPRCAGDCVAVGKWDISIGLGYGIRSNPVIGQKDIPYIVVPSVSYYGQRFFLNNYDFGYTLWDNEQHQLNALIFTPGFEHIFFNEHNIRQYDVKTSAVSPPAMPGDPNTDPSSPTVSPSDKYHTSINLHKRRTAALSGFEYTFIGEHFDWQTQFLQDVSSTHKGQKVRTALTYPWQFNRQQWLLSTGLTWQSKKLIDYYYGIHANDTALTEMHYTANASLAFHVGLEWEKYFSKHWSLRGVANYRWLGDSVKDSPIVEDDAVSTLFMAGVYHF